MIVPPVEYGAHPRRAVALREVADDGSPYAGPLTIEDIRSNPCQMNRAELIRQAERARRNHEHRARKLTETSERRGGLVSAEESRQRFHAAQRDALADWLETA